MKLFATSLLAVVTAACGLQSVLSKSSHVQNLEVIGVGQKPVVLKGEVVRLREPIVLPNGQQRVRLPGKLGCEIVALSIDDINDRAISTETPYTVSGWEREYSGSDYPMWVSFTKANLGIDANFYFACRNPEGQYYNDQEIVIAITAHFFQFERFPNYNPGGNTTPTPNPAPNPTPNPTPSPCTGIHARCTYIGDRDTSVYTRSGCDLNAAKDLAMAACLAAGNQSCFNSTCDEF